MSDMNQIEISIEQAQKLVDRKNQIEKLTSNREFRKVIIDGYFNEEAARLAGIAGDPLHARDRDDILLCIQGISKLRLYLSNAIRMGQMAESELHDHNELLEEMRANDGNYAHEDGEAA